MKKRRNMLITLELVLVVLCVLFMYILQSRLFYHNANREIDLTNDDLARILDQANESTDDIYNSYDLIIAAKAKMAKFYIRNDEDTVYSTASMKHLKALLDVYNVYIIDAKGNVTYAAVDTGVTNISDLGDGDNSFLASIQKIIGTNEASEVNEYPVSTDSANIAFHSYCAASLNNGDFVVVENDANELVEQQGASNSWDVVLPRITLGKNGFVFAVDDQGLVYAFDQGRDNEVYMIEQLGISMDMIKDGFRGTINLVGVDYYCGITYNDRFGVYTICAIPSDEITSNVVVVTAVPLFIAFIFMSLQLLYSLMLIGEPRDSVDGNKPESLRKFLFRKMAILLVLALLFSVASSLFPQIMYAMYLQADSNKKEADALVEQLERNEELQKQISDKYYKDLENLTTLAARFISNNPSQITRTDLEIIAKSLGAEHVLLYNKAGRVFLSDAYYSGLRLSTDPDDLSYEFRKVLTGTPVLAQKKIDKTYLENPYRYVGAIVTDQNNDLNGFVQLLFSPDFLSASLSESGIESLPATFSGRNNAYAFIVDDENKTFLYYPDESFKDEPVEGTGITEEMMQDRYFSRAFFDGEKKLLYCESWNKNLIFTAASVSIITVESISRGIYVSLAGILIQLLFFIGMLYINEGSPFEPDSEGADQWTREDQRRLVENLAAGRIVSLLRISFFIFSGVVTFILLLKDFIFRNNDVIRMLLNGYWNTGVHVFSVTECFVISCTVYFTVSLLLLVLELAGRLMNSRGETIIRMLISFTRYIAVIGLVFYCAKLLGAPTDTLLASAGILTIVVGLGAQSLVTDILAGLFIIFEKAYKVGDVIKIDGEDWRGRVLEIGIRNTRVIDVDANNIRVLHNSSINQIINLSDLPTCIYTTIGTEYGEKLSRIEEVIEKELPAMHGRIPGAIEGPLYRGVSELGDSAVILKFRTKCRNEDYYPVSYAVNRELKLMFDKYDINVPFPQVVINRREDSADKKAQADNTEKFSP
ncbi:MAG: mechanosensitive ion channel family protein [Butyrivibrio sp.]|nr:mechanosensitive ion channel family protein [Butyrivibrio sp.]